MKQPQLKITVFLLLFYFIPYAQNSERQIAVRYIDESITLDGNLDEKIWSIAESASDFWQFFPSDTAKANQKTNIRFLYDDTSLYIGIEIFSSGNNFVIPSLQRDFRAGGNDNISLVFDTFNDGTNAFLFGINPLGVMREALISGGGANNSGFTTAWDIKWKSETRLTENGYTAEIEIPLTSFKFKDGETKWRFNSYRFDTQSNETSTWANIPQNQSIFGLAYMGDMVFEKPLGRSRTPLALIPYVTSYGLKDFEKDDSRVNGKIGGDAKISVTNSLNLDLTINPDFSQVENDNLVTNTTRFEISLPERRQFFIDNNDLFGDFGNSFNANPFFSRRIGIASDKDENTIQNDIIAGIRLSGKIGTDWRIGLLNVQTEEDIPNEIASNNHTVFVLQKKVFARSNVGMIVVNRETFDDPDFLEASERYNRVVGIDYNLASADNTWEGSAYLHKSFTPETDNDDLSGGLNLEYNSRKWNANLFSRYVGTDFQADLGFVTRNDVISVNPSIERVFWPEKSKINNHSLEFSPTYIWRPDLDYKNTDYTLRTRYRIEFLNQSNFSARINNIFVFLDEPFDPTGTDGARELDANRGYRYDSFELEFESDRRKTFSFNINPGIGTFFNGEQYTIEGDIRYRIQPYFSGTLTLDYRRIELAEGFPSASIWTVEPRFEVTFSKSIFWTTLVQYSNRDDNLGVNSRLQWRFAQLSDLFIVYNDNYFTQTIAPKNRSISVKLTYWLNI
ncbi:MAG: carbohydrate binding family 9 domain-containing protein [Bacteroidetes bacterium]|nr:carbohydrate binding family 9 domain-containing protein [Bacteroidota bacterium]